MRLDKRRAAKWGGAAVGLLVLLIAMAPYLASMGLFRNTLLRAVMPPIHGSVHCAGASLGWFSPILFQEIEIRSADDAPVVTVDRLEGNRPLWKMLLNRSDLGAFRIERPQLNVVLSEHGSNLAEVFVGRRLADEKQRPSKPPNVSLRIELVEGALSCRSADSPRSWAARPINFAFALEPSSASADGQPQLVIEPGTVLPRTQVTPEACHDLLMYIAPILAGATEVGGEFSIEVDRWRLPLAEPASGEGSGRLTISSLDIGPGPLVAELAALLGVPPKLRIVEDAPVTFRMADGRIHHSDLEFRIDRLVVRTHGSVGLDGSLALVAEVPVPKHLLGDGPLASALAGQTLAIPIAGTLSHPRIDAEGLGDSGLDLLSGTLGDLLKDDKVDLGAMIKDGKADLGAVLEAIQQLRRRGEATADPSGKAPGDKPAPLLDAIRGALGEKTPVLDRLRQRRQDRDASPRDPKGADPP
jgi:hypothetical protein